MENMNMRILTLACAGLMVALAGCASMPQQNQALDDARVAVQRLAEEPNASQVAGKQLQDARTALALADGAAASHKSSGEVTHLAYLARRQADLGEATLAEASARAKIAEGEANRNRVLLEAREREVGVARQQAREAQAGAATSEAGAAAARESEQNARAQTRDAQAGAATSEAGAAAARESEQNARAQTRDAQAGAVTSEAGAAAARESEQNARAQTRDAQAGAAASEAGAAAARESEQTARAQARDAQAGAAASEAGAAAARQSEEDARAQARDAQAGAAASEADAAAARQSEDRARSQLRDLQAKETERGLVLTLGNVLFDTANSSLKPGAFLILDHLASFMKSSPGTKIIVEGHTDSRGAEEYNQQLSRSRAQSVAEGLGSRGIGAERIEAVGRGERFPVASNDTAEGRQDNRRVEIVFSNTHGQFARIAAR
jgi:outer membrane protein OmpA-like peptidoglycan-associated protein